MKKINSILLIALITSTPAMAQDVYNFYFQKNNPGTTATTPTAPGTPGVDQKAVTASPETTASVPAANNVKTDLKQEDKTSAILKRMELGIGKAWVNSNSKRKTPSNDTSDDSVQREAIGILGTYRFNKFVAAEGGFFITTGWQEVSKEYDKVANGQGFEGSVGLSVTPIHLNVFGYELLEVGITGGMMSITKYKAKEKTNGNGETEIDSGDANKIYGVYFGPKVAVNITPAIAAVFELKNVNGLASTSSLAVRYRF